MAELSAGSTMHLGRSGQASVYGTAVHRSPGVWQRVRNVRVTSAAMDAARDAAGIALLSCAGATISATLGLIVAGLGCLTWRKRVR